MIFKRLVFLKYRSKGSQLHIEEFTECRHIPQVTEYLLM